jgi:hypothetical protein
MGGLSLGNALALCVVLAERDSVRFRRAGPRWLARFVDEADGVSLEEAHLLVAAALAALPAAPSLARPVLRELVRVRGLVTVRFILETPSRPRIHSEGAENHHEDDLLADGLGRHAARALPSDRAR